MKHRHPFHQPGAGLDLSLQFQVLASREYAPERIK
jgi:hypothetical protein